MKLRRRAHIFLSKYGKPFKRLPAWLQEKISVSDQIRKIRTALGMTQNQLAKRAQTTQQAVALIESGKVDLRLSSLQKLASAMECELLIRFIPKEIIEKICQEQAMKKARLLVGLSSGSTALEQQLPSKEFIENKIQEVAEELMKNKLHTLWE